MFGKKSENILIIKADTIAGFVAAEPVFEAIRNAHPDARISLLTNPSLQRIARAAPYFDQVASLPDFKDSVARQAFVKQVKTAKFARVYDLAGDSNSRKIQGSMGPFGPKWIVAEPQSRKQKDAREQLSPDVEKLTTQAGIEPVNRLPDLSWALDARKDSANMKPSWFGISGAFALLLPGLDPDKRWPARRYGEFARKLSSEGIMPVMVGGNELHQLGDQIAHEAPQIVDLSGKADHLQLTALAREALFFVSDCAEEVHVAVSVGCSGVLIKKNKDAHLAPSGRHLLTLTVQSDMDEATAEHVWRALGNLGLLPQDSARTRAHVR